MPSEHRPPPPERLLPAPQGSGEPEEINVGVFVAHTPGGDVEALEAFADRLVRDVGAVLEEASGVAWRFYLDDATRLRDDGARRPTDFLDEAALLMVEGPFDAVVVVTDVDVVSRRLRAVPGLASPVARMAVVSTRRLVTSPRGERTRPLDAEVVRWNAAALLLRLLGHILGLASAARGPMSPFQFDPARTEAPTFPEASRPHIRALACAMPAAEAEMDGLGSVLRFHLVSAARNAGHVGRAVWRSRAPLLPLSLPTFVAAAFAPAILLVFSAETWDVGLTMSDGVAAAFAVGAVLTAATFLVWVQNLTFPWKDRRLITEHVAVVNVVLALTLLFAVMGLFVMVGALMLAIEVFVFPPGLMATWPTLETPEVTFRDHVRLAAFTSSVGVLTGALGGGLESRDVIRQLALFRERP